ncbi:MAG TPA: CPXCG motif-containing cysteine-rich protein [Myxococcota bacterium]|jgi:hypothetical protein
MDVVTVQCPYCFESVEIDIDPETEGSFVQDCEVCCHPWQLHVTRDHDGDISVTVTGAD